MASLKHLFCLLGFAFCVTSCFANEPAPRLYIFGDSLFDAGNNLIDNPNSVTGKLPYGMNIEPKYRGRASDGFLLPDFIAKLAKFDDVMPPSMKKGANFSQGANFAFAGANVFGGKMGLDNQTAAFITVKDKLDQEIGQTETTKVMKRSVFLFTFGGVPYYHFKSANPNPTVAQKVAHVNQVLEKLKAAMKRVYSAGGRRFAWQKVMPLGCTPGNRVAAGGLCEQHLMDLANLHNTAFIKVMRKLQIELSGFEYSIFDYFNALGERIMYPTTNGFKVGNAVCNGAKLCSNPNEYVFWDGVHPTQIVNKQLAELFWSGGPEVTRPMNLQQLFQLPTIETNNLLESVVA